MKGLLCALGIAALALPAAQAATLTVPGLVYTPGYGNSILTSINPTSLVRGGPRVRLGGNASSWSWSPHRRYLAVASHPQRLTVVDVPAARAVARVRLAASGGVRAVTWPRRDRVLALVEAPRGVVVVAVDPLAGRVVRRTAVPRPFAFEFERVPGGLVFLAGSRRSVGPVRLVRVDAEGRVRVAAILQVPAGVVVGRGLQDPGLAVDPAGRTAYVVSGDRVFPVDLRTLDVSGPRPLRTLAKVAPGTSRAAEWLGDGRLALSGVDRDAETGAIAPAGLRIVDVRSWTVRVVDREATGFTLAARRLLVESAASRRALSLSAYGLDGRELYRRELEGSTWLKKQGRLGYACRDAFLRSVIDLPTGSTVRSGFPAGTRCPTVLAGDSRG
jgi:hypothetical protein